jgi:hypothetical protein
MFMKKQYGRQRALNASPSSRSRRQEHAFASTTQSPMPRQASGRSERRALSSVEVASEATIIVESAFYFCYW